MKLKVTPTHVSGAEAPAIYVDTNNPSTEKAFDEAKNIAKEKSGLGKFMISKQNPGGTWRFVVSYTKFNCKSGYIRDKFKDNESN